MSRNAYIMAGTKPDEMGGSARRRIMEPTRRIEHWVVASSQKGSALILALLILVVLTVVGITGANQALLQERMAGNSVYNTRSFLAAEDAVSSAFEVIKEKTEESAWSADDWDDKQWQSSVEAELLQSMPSEPNAGSHGFAWVSDIQWTEDGVSLVGQGAADASAQDAHASISIFVSKPESGDVHPAFKRGMLSEGRIRVNGGLDIVGDAHSNSEIDLTGQSSAVEGATLSSVGEVDSRGIDSESIVENADRVDVPSADDHINSVLNDSGGSVEVLEVSTQGGGPNRSPSCELDAEGDQEGAIYYCDGDLTMGGDFHNATVMASGDMTHNGSSELGQDGVDTALIAAGDLTLNGSSETAYGVFWADGNVTQNGDSVLSGSIVAGGEITSNGGLEFEQNDDIGGPLLPPGQSKGASMSGWAQLID